MKKLMAVVLPMKNFAAMIFTGFIALYLVTGTLYAVCANAEFDFKIPFVFVLEGMALSLIISALWSALFSEKRKCRAYIRLIAFAAALAASVIAGAFAFPVIPDRWSALWVAVTCCIVLGVIVMAILGEAYYRREGKRYTKALREFQANL
jgi:uncharacterized membrane protein YfcA